MNKWEASESALAEFQKMIKRRKKVAAFFNSDAKFGEVYDPLKEEIITISEATEQTLRRLSGSLNAMYKSSEVKDERRNYILEKKQEIDSELLNRKKK